MDIVCLHNSVQPAGSDAVEEARADHPVGVLGRALETRAEHCPPGTEANRLDAANLVADPSTEETPDQGPKVID